MPQHTHTHTHISSATCCIHTSLTFPYRGDHVSSLFPSLKSFFFVSLCARFICSPLNVSFKRLQRAEAKLRCSTSRLTRCSICFCLCFSASVLIFYFFIYIFDSFLSFFSLAYFFCYNSVFIAFLFHLLPARL
jgi:hypothetical protein